MSEFAGFPTAGSGFLRDLKTNNTKAWFDAHRSTYETEVLDVGRGFVQALGKRLATTVPELRFEPKVGKSIGRINRDIRFSNDKTPYNTHLSYHFWTVGEKARGGPGFAVFLDDEAVWFGGGVHQFGKERMASWQQAAAGPAGAELAELVDELEAQHGATIHGEQYKRVPKPHEATHAREGLIRRKGLYATWEFREPGIMEGADLVERLATHLASTAPLVDWLARQLWPQAE